MYKALNGAVTARPHMGKYNTLAEHDIIACGHDAIHITNDIENEYCNVKSFRERNSYSFVRQI